MQDKRNTNIKIKEIKEKPNDLKFELEIALWTENLTFPKGKFYFHWKSLQQNDQLWWMMWSVTYISHLELSHSFSHLLEVLIAKSSQLSPSLGITLIQRQLSCPRSGHSFPRPVHIQWLMYEGAIKTQHLFLKVGSRAPIGSAKISVPTSLQFNSSLCPILLLSFPTGIGPKGTPNKLPAHKSLSQSISPGTQLKTPSQDQLTSQVCADWGIKI